jgi:hypothetical protein
MLGTRTHTIRQTVRGIYVLSLLCKNATIAYRHAIDFASQSSSHNLPVIHTKTADNQLLFQRLTKYVQSEAQTAL